MPETNPLLSSNPFLILDERMSRIESILLELQAKSNSPVKEPEPANNARPITTKELCEFLKITPQTLIRWKKKKKVPYIQIGTEFRFFLSDVLKALGK